MEKELNVDEGIRPGFDFRVEVRDKHGNIVKYQPYRMTIVDGVRVFERDGKKYHENGEEIVQQKLAVATVAEPVLANQSKGQSK